MRPVSRGLVVLDTHMYHCNGFHRNSVKQKDSYQLVGKCYIDGIMQGEEFDENAREQQPEDSDFGCSLAI